MLCCAADPPPAPPSLPQPFGLTRAELLQVLNLSHCGLNDTGGAAICLALLQQDTLLDLHLSWNALSSMTAKALESALRWVARLSCVAHGGG